MNAIIRLIENALWPFRVTWSYASRFLRFGKYVKKGPALSVAAKASTAFFLCLAIFITIVWVTVAWNMNLFSRADIPGIPSWLEFPIFYVIALLIAIAVYWGIRLATRERPSLYPEIDQCWEPIEAWRQKTGFDWDDFNRYLVLGPDLETSKAMHAEMKDRKIGALPGGVNDWMHWFGSQSNLYLHLKKTCQLSDRLQKLSGSRSVSVDPTSTLQASIGAADWEGSLGVDAMTEEVGGYGDSMAGFGESLDPAQSLDPYDSGEINVTDLGDGDQGEGPIDEDDEIGEDGDTPLDRIQYVCDLLVARTQGQMPFNGVLVVLPFDKFMFRENYKTIATAVKKDLLEIRRRTDIEFPVSFLFCSMEKDQGFPKLQNLLGEKRSASGRFGAGCRISDIPAVEKENLSIQVHRACHSFEEWVLNRWGKSSQLSRAAQNKELYKMVIRVRQQFQPKLVHLLQHTLIWPSSELSAEHQDLTLAGCYFASTGSSSSERGFLNGVFAKCDEFAEITSWGEKIVNQDRAYSAFATLFSVLSVMIIVATGCYLYFWSA